MTTMTNNKKAFVLIEVIISVILLSFAGIALLKVNSNQKKIYTIASKKLEFSKYISVITDQHSASLHKKELNLYTLVKSRYDIKNSALIDILKNTKVKYSQKYKSMINLKIAKDLKPINILIDEIIISDKKGTSKYMTVQM